MDRILVKPKYSEILEKLSLPADTDKVKKCEFCNGLLHLIRVNDMVGFWVHKGDDVTQCGEKNLVYPGKPMIVQNMNFYRQMAQIWMGIRANKEKVEDGGDSPN